MQRWFEKNGFLLDYINDDKLRILSEKFTRGGPVSLVGKRYVKRSDSRELHYWDTHSFYESSNFLPTGNFDEIEVSERKKQF